MKIRLLLVLVLFQFQTYLAKSQDTNIVSISKNEIWVDPVNSIFIFKRQISFFPKNKFLKVALGYKSFLSTGVTIIDTNRYYYSRKLHNAAITIGLEYRNELFKNISVHYGPDLHGGLKSIKVDYDAVVMSDIEFINQYHVGIGVNMGMLYSFGSLLSFGCSWIPFFMISVDDRDQIHAVSLPGKSQSPGIVSLTNFYNSELAIDFSGFGGYLVLKF